MPESGEVELLIRVHKGITARMATLSQGQGWTGTALLDGPYGGIPVEMGAYEHVVLMAGGSGTSGKGMLQSRMLLTVVLWCRRLFHPQRR